MYMNMNEQATLYKINVDTLSDNTESHTHWGDT